jgi:hypothetical protein
MHEFDSDLGLCLPCGSWVAAAPCFPWAISAERDVHAVRFAPLPYTQQYIAGRETPRSVGWSQAERNNCSCTFPSGD